MPPSVILMKISWQVTLLRLQFVDGTTITTKYFNATNAHNYVLFKQTFWDKVCSKRILWSCHHWEKNAWKSKRTYWPEYRDFNEPVLDSMKWFDPQTSDQKRQEVGQITSFREYFREPLDHVNFLLNFCLKEI